MDAHLFRIFCRYCEPLLIGARIEKIQEFASDHLAISFFGGRGKQYLYFRFGRKDPFCFLSNERVTALPKPSPAIMRLRKYFSGRRIAAVVAQVWSRKLWLMAEGDPPVWLCLDLVSGASIHFLKGEIPASEPAEWPSRGLDMQKREVWRSLRVLTPALRATLAWLDEPEQAALISDLADGSGDIFLYLDEEGEAVRISAWPLPAKLKGQWREQVYEDCFEAFEKAGRSLVLQALFVNRMSQAMAPVAKRKKQLGKILAKLEQDRTRLQAMVAFEEDGRALAENLWRFARGMKQENVEVMCCGKATQIKLDPRYTIRENMERIFHGVRRGKRGLELLEKRRQEVEAELGSLAALADLSGQVDKKEAHMAQAVVPNQPAHCQIFLSSDGYVILRGKDARGNQVIRKKAAGHDIWAHVEQGAGAHVLIRLPYAGHEVPERTLIEAGTLAANKSWLKEASSGAVMYAEARHIKPCRSGPPGKVLIDKLRATRIVPVDHGLESRLLPVAKAGD